MRHTLRNQEESVLIAWQESSAVSTSFLCRTPHLLHWVSSHVIEPECFQATSSRQHLIAATLKHAIVDVMQLQLGAVA